MEGPELREGVVHMEEGEKSYRVVGSWEHKGRVLGGEDGEALVVGHVRLLSTLAFALKEVGSIGRVKSRGLLWLLF